MSEDEPDYPVAIAQIAGLRGQTPASAHSSHEECESTPIIGGSSIIENVAWETHHGYQGHLIYTFARKGLEHYFWETIFTVHQTIPETFTRSCVNAFKQDSVQQLSQSAPGDPIAS